MFSDNYGLKISIPYKAPFEFGALLNHYRNYKIGELEEFDEHKMYRIVNFENTVGKVAISDEPQKNSVLVEIDYPEALKVDEILSRVKAMFDLESDPEIIAKALSVDDHFKKIVEKHPGLRMPSGWDSFELAIGTILGQLVSTQRARELVRDLIELVGSEIVFEGKSIRLFPTPEQLANADLEKLKTTKIRKRTLKTFAQHIVDKTLSFDPDQDADQFIKNALSISGIGPWTANYMALKCLRHADAFPGSDLILARALQIHSRSTIEKMSPWQGYAAILLWREYAGLLKKEKSK